MNVLIYILLCWLAGAVFSMMMWKDYWLYPKYSIPGMSIFSRIDWEDIAANVVAWPFRVALEYFETGRSQAQKVMIIEIVFGILLALVMYGL